MEKSQMIEEMCLKELGKGDIKAIVKARGFSPEAGSSPQLLAQVFLSRTGLQRPIDALNEEERRMLHLLAAIGQPVDIRFFQRIYHPQNAGHSFNDRFKGVFQQVRSRFLLQGLLLYATPQQGWGSTTTALERRRFLFPPEFAALLPPLLRSVRFETAVSGASGTDLTRRNLAALAGREDAAAPDPSENGFRLEQGKLFLGKDRFSIQAWQEWRLASADRSIGFRVRDPACSIAPLRLALYALGGLAPGEWATLEELLPFWSLAYPREPEQPDPRVVGRAGREYGCLERVETKEGILYRLPVPDPAQKDPAPEDYVDLRDAEAAGIDPEKVPLEVLERLGRVCALTGGRGRLWARPNLIDFGRRPQSAAADPVLLWLSEHHPAFKEAARKRDQRRGKTVVHSNLLVARVTDLSLKVALERELGRAGHLVCLSDEFVAFPRGVLPVVRRVVKKTGNVIRTIISDEQP